LTARLPDPARSRAVLIGAGTYAEPELPGLPGVPNNLIDLRAVLTAPGGSGLPDAHCVVLADPPDAATVGLGLAKAAAEAEDLLLVYYAGHGLLGNGGELFFALGNTNPAIVGMSALPCAEVRQVFRNSAAPLRVFIVDCCLSGRAFEPTMSASADALLGMLDLHGAYVLTATRPNQLALAPQGLRNTLFTGELLRVLREGIPGGPELLTLDVLYGHLHASLRRRNLPTPSSNANGSAAHLALAPNSARTGDIADLQQRLTELEALARDFPALVRDLRDAIGKLGDAESETEKIYSRALDRFAEPNLPPPRGLAPELYRRAGELERLGRDGQWLRVAGELDGLRREVAEAAEGADRLRTLASGLFDRREELRGRLKVLLAKAVRHGVAEDGDTTARYAVAHNELWTKPCDLRAATLAVLAYQDRVLRGREDGQG